MLPLTGEVSWSYRSITSCQAEDITYLLQSILKPFERQWFDWVHIALQNARLLYISCASPVET